MLEHVRQAGDTRDLPGRADIDVGEERDDGGFGAFIDKEGEPVGEAVLGESLFERGKILARYAQRRGKEAQRQGKPRGEKRDSRQGTVSSFNHPDFERMHSGNNRGQP